LEHPSPLISVVIPNYNYGRFLGQAIESVLEQTYKHVQLIVVDNESTDNSVEVAMQFGDKLTLIRKPHGGVSSARNLGFSQALGEFICFLDSDDTWLPQKLASQLVALQSSSAGVVYSGVNLCNQDMKREAVLTPKFRGNCADKFLRHPTSAIILLGCSNAMIKREIAVEVGLFNTSLHFSADWDYFRRVCDLADVEYVDALDVNYRRHQKSMSSGSIVSFYDDNELAIREFIHDIRKSTVPKYPAMQQFSLWIRFQFQAVKAMLRAGLVMHAIKRFRRIFLYFSIPSQE